MLSVLIEKLACPEEFSAMLLAKTVPVPMSVRVTTPAVTAEPPEVTVAVKTAACPEVIVLGVTESVVVVAA